MIQNLYTGPGCPEKKNLLTHYLEFDEEVSMEVCRGGRCKVKSVWLYEVEN